MGIGPNKGVRVIQVALGQNTLGKVFQVDLMNDADARRNHLESIKGLHAPLEELVAFTVAAEFLVEIAVHGIAGSSMVHLNGVIHNQVNGHERFDHLGILTQAIDSRTHGGQIHK